MSNSDPYSSDVDARPEIVGLDLRYWLNVVIAEHGGPITIGELVDEIELRYRTRDRTSKAVSDALRWEVARGRILRLRRGVYQAGVIPRSTFNRMRRRVRALEDHAAAVVADLSL